MNFIFGELTSLRRVSSKNAKRIGLAAANGYCNTTDYPMLKQQWTPAELRFGLQILDHHGFTCPQRESRLRPLIDRKNAIPNGAGLPANPRAQQQVLALRAQLENPAVLDLEGLGNQHYRLVQERGEVLADERKLSERADDGLLQGSG